MKTEDAAWLAGFWDGEGTITVFKHQEKQGNWKLCPTIVVVNTDPNLINKVQKLLIDEGINLHLFTRVQQNKNHATSYQLTTRNTDYILKFVELVKPYLVGKKAQAEIAERFCLSRKGNRTKNGSPLPYTDNEWKMCESMYVLNAKGVSRALNDYVSDTEQVKI